MKNHDKLKLTIYESSMDSIHKEKLINIIESIEIDDKKLLDSDRRQEISKLVKDYKNSVANIKTNVSRKNSEMARENLRLAKKQLRDLSYAVDVTVETPSQRFMTEILRSLAKTFVTFKIIDLLVKDPNGYGKGIKTGLLMIEPANIIINMKSEYFGGWKGIMHREIDRHEKTLNKLEIKILKLERKLRKKEEKSDKE